MYVRGLEHRPTGLRVQYLKNNPKAFFIESDITDPNSTYLTGPVAVIICDIHFISLYSVITVYVINVIFSYLQIYICET